jgi:hypothetical protein
MPKPFDVVAFLSSAAMMARKAESYHPERYVIDLAESLAVAGELLDRLKRFGSKPRSFQRTAIGFLPVR